MILYTLNLMPRHTLYAQSRVKLSKFPYVPLAWYSGDWNPWEALRLARNCLQSLLEETKVRYRNLVKLLHSARGYAQILEPDLGLLESEVKIEH